ncbi:hypothetical protein SARC_15986 [Sphaeroforma arctica JP610]|uniref:Uncharacterized protein n=1 Tax=Sphaeroforma arctica JP610 TaxID=667725 RepID=A0A0L0F4C1_9EUKA|nr:hypothetical protein SARC_15986 [Sphaeroforma arctica JP610]KNC71474.1 hypothetical protein SARC_15986 [Sphaeroforma arctica JP610]|eukprot:XP_014145376.1 hypothetical protein SARC_15986 [Sphaeroforma arctica JP610]
MCDADGANNRSALPYRIIALKDFMNMPVLGTPNNSVAPSVDTVYSQIIFERSSGEQYLEGLWLFGRVVDVLRSGQNWKRTVVFEYVECSSVCRVICSKTWHQETSIPEKAHICEM